MTDRRRVAILGAGPIGLEAALQAHLLNYDIAVFERAPQIAAHIRDWGHVRMFSPFGMNSSAEGRRALRQVGHDLPREDELLSGAEFVDRYLLPLSRLTGLSRCLHFGCEVFRVGREASLKTEHIGISIREREKFRIVFKNGASAAEADIVLDCTGVFGQPNWLGQGGLPCHGELTLARDPESGLSGAGPAEIEYRLPLFEGKTRERFAGKATLVIGSGYSAATNVLSLAALHDSHPATRIVWITRRPTEAPVRRYPDDSLGERDRIAASANALALSGASPVTWRPGAVVRRIRRDTAAWSIEVTGADGRGDGIVVNQIIANVGYRPDRSLYEELHVHECYASQAPMKLAARLLGEISSDCLAQTSHGPDVLRNPEPSFFILGAKSYGRRNDFLLGIGLEQVQDVFRLLHNDPMHP